MSFKEMSQITMDLGVSLIGEPVMYHSISGVTKPVNAIIIDGIDIFTNESESGVSEYRVKVKFARSDLPDFIRDDIIVTEDNITYKLKEELSEGDKTMLVVTAK
jgi:hypothetical protein